MVEEKQQQQPNSALLLTGRPRCSLVTVLHFSGRSARPRINPPRLARYFRHARSVTAPTRTLLIFTTPNSPRRRNRFLPKSAPSCTSRYPHRAIRHGYDLIGSYLVCPISPRLPRSPFLGGDSRVCRAGPWCRAMVIPHPIRPGYCLIGPYLVRTVLHVTVSAPRNPSRLRSTSYAWHALRSILGRDGSL